jgi:hypothetical protein
MAGQLNLPFWLRGPPGPECGGPPTWKKIPWNRETQHWTWTRQAVRENLPEYNWDDWNDEDALTQEHAAAAIHHLPWNVRGPPGPKNGGPQTWRGMTYRPGTDKWMKRGLGKHAKADFPQKMNL